MDKIVCPKHGEIKDCDLRDGLCLCIDCGSICDIIFGRDQIDEYPVGPFPDLSDSQNEAYERIVNEQPSSDQVNEPDHYTQHPSGIEPIQIARFESFPVGSAIKYVMRRKFKGNEILDLEKAIRCLQFELETLRMSENNS